MSEIEISGGHEFTFYGFSEPLPAYALPQARDWNNRVSKITRYVIFPDGQVMKLTHNQALISTDMGLEAAGAITNLEEVFIGTNARFEAREDQQILVYEPDTKVNLDYNQ